MTGIRWPLASILVLVLFTACRHGTETRSMVSPQAPLKYPQAPKDNTVDVYHGVSVADPYRWLEDSDSPRTRAWIEEQNKITSSFLSAIRTREAIRQRLTALWDHERFSSPFKVAGRYFYFRNSGLQNQAVLYMTRSLEAEPVVLLDPNLLSTDGTVALTDVEVSPDGRLMAYALAHAGSDWSEWHIKDVESGKDLPDVLKWSKFSAASWTRDGQGLFYSRYPEPKAGAALEETNYFQKLCFHRLGTPQDQDLVVYERPDQKEWMFDGLVTDDGRYLFISVTQGTDHKNQLFYKDLSNPSAKVVELVTDFKAEYSPLGNDGTVFWMKTDLDAPRGRIIRVDLAHPEKQHWQEVVPQAEETLADASLLQDRLFLNYMKDARSLVRVVGKDGRFIQEVALPGLGTATGFNGRRENQETFYSFTSFTAPTTLFRLDVMTGQSSVFKRSQVEFNPDDYVTEQVFYTSKDGTRVPMFLAHRKGLKRDGNNPTYLYGYGGFAVSLTPLFKVSWLTWMEMGGVVAVPNLRGGGEYGEQWHQAGVKLRKQNVFDDFVSAAQWLISNKYTSPSRLAISGGSNGGLLVGACMTQRPDLFAAAIPEVGVLDMLRFHKFTIGWAWVDDYGSSEDPEQFKALYAYSPLHNVKPGSRYPATLITTADHDDRVVPAHSFKFAATLQQAQSGPAPVLIRIETKAGHGAGKPISKMIDEEVDRWAFLSAIMDVQAATR